jgi:hypothetical protein
VASPPLKRAGPGFNREKNWVLTRTAEGSINKKTSTHTKLINLEKQRDKLLNTSK